MDDEQAHDKGEQAEGGQTEMKAFGQLPQVADLLRPDQAKLITNDRGQRRCSSLSIRASGLTNKRETRSGSSKSFCATPMSTTSTPGASSARAVKGGRARPPSMTGVAPSWTPKSRSVSAETTVCQGGNRKLARSASLLLMLRRLASRGSVTGSIPTS